MAQPFTDALQTWLKKRLLVTDRFMRSSACGFHQGQESKDSTNRPDTLTRNDLLQRSKKGLAFTGQTIHFLEPASVSASIA
jgi:hypothetical protein